MTLFDGKEDQKGPQDPRADAPLAARMRPRTLEEFVGQEHFIGEGALLRRMIKADRLGAQIGTVLKAPV